MTLTRCEDSSGLQVVPFGLKNENPVCGKITSVESGNRAENVIDPTLTELFKKMWSSSGSNGNAVGNSNWKAKCLNSNNGWTLDQPDGSEYLGYCGNSIEHKDSAKTNFLEIKKVDSTAKEIKFCFQNCWKSPDSTTGIYSLSSVNGEQGKKLEFFKK